MSGPMSRELVYLENLPKQKDATSCGIFMLEYIRKMIDTGGIPDEWSFAQEDIPWIRKRIAVELFQQDLMELN
jgi:Ulp1 family protease